MNNATTNFIKGGADSLVLGQNISTDNAFTLTLGNLAAPTTGDATSGFALASTDFGTVDAPQVKLYTGLLSGTTNLGGAYVDTTTGSATWNGRLQLILGDTSIGVDDFTLLITFGASGGSFTSTTALNGGLDGLILAGDYSGTSTLITAGTASISRNKGLTIESTTGVLSGLFGKDGVIAVFKSTETGVGKTDFVGGFVASDTATNYCESNPFSVNCLGQDDYADERLGLVVNCAKPDGIGCSEFNTCTDITSTISNLFSDTVMFALNGVDGEV